MQTVKRAYKYRCYPDEVQAQQLAQTFGCVRVAYNGALHYRSTAYSERGESVNYGQSSAWLTALKKDDDYAWLNEVSSVPLQQSLRNLNTAFSNFFKQRAKYPRFKNKHARQSAEYTRSGFKYRDGQLTLAKMREPLDVRWSRRFDGEPTTVTVSKDAAGRYFVSMLVEESIAPLPAMNKATGIDLGITDVVVTCDGWKSGAPKNFRKNEARLALLQRRLAKKQKRSANRAKARLKVAKLHAKIADARRDFAHKLTTRLVLENQVLSIEDLAVSNMVKNHSLAKSISDSGWGELVSMLEYKAAWYGRTVVRVSRWLPSSKTCSDCGVVQDSMPLSVRKWACGDCGAEHLRDHNAAKNIRTAGLAELACGETVNPVLAQVSMVRLDEAGIPAL